MSEWPTPNGAEPRLPAEARSAVTPIVKNPPAAPESCAVAGNLTTPVREPPPAPERVVLCGGAYSDNLGDVIIADCLAYALSQHLPRTQIVRMDISGRLEYGAAGFGPRGRIMRLLRAFPKVIGNFLALFAGSWYVKRVIEPSWRRTLAHGDAIVIGGGQLFQDEHLNFPIKIWWLVRNIRRNSAGTAVYSVGVSREWSLLGRLLFRPVFRSPRLYCSVRDLRSKENLLTHLPQIAPSEVRVDPDPALLAHLVYRVGSGTMAKQFDVGIGLMDPSMLRYDPRQRHTAFDSTTHKWISLIQELLSMKFSIGLFTNGTREDVAYLKHVAQEFQTSPQLTILERASNPADFVSNMSRMRSTISHRLHASIVSYSLDVPSIGLQWDPKVESFYAMCDREEWIVDFSALSAREIAHRGSALVGSTIDPAARDTVVRDCCAGVGRLASYLSQLAHDPH